MKFAKLSLFLFLGASFAGAATLTVSPNGQYPTVCSALNVAVNGDTVLVDANHGIPTSLPPTRTMGMEERTANLKPTI